MTLGEDKLRSLGTVSALALLGVLAMTAPVTAQNRFTVDASASAGIATNPFLDSGATPTALSTTLSVHPIWVSERPLTTLRVEGDAAATFYSKRYRANESFSLQASGTHKLSEYTTLNASLGYFNAIIGSFNDIRVPVGTLVPVGADLPTFVNDPALGAIGNRRQSYQTSANLVSLLSLRDQIEVGVSASASRFAGASFNDFNYAAPTASYSRALSENSSIGVSMSVGFTSYRQASVGDAIVYQPSLTTTQTISERWILQASAGASVINLKEPLGESRTTTTLSGSAQLCRRDTRWTACFSLSRQTIPSAFQGVRTTTAASVSLGYQMSERDSLSFNGSYSSAGDPLQQTFINTNSASSLNFLNTSANYSRRIRQNISGFVSGGYGKSFGDNIRRKANITAIVGVTYTFDGR